MQRDPMQENRTDDVPQGPPPAGEDADRPDTGGAAAPGADTSANSYHSAHTLLGASYGLPPDKKPGIAARMYSQGCPGFIPALAWGLALVSLCIGLALGVLVMRHRDNTQKTVATVNGAEIREDALFTRLQEAAGVPLMHKMVEEELQLQFAKKKGVPATDAQVEARFQQMSRDPRLAASLASSAVGEQTFKDALKQSLRVRIAQANVLTRGVTISDVEARAFYAAQSDPRNPQAQFYKPETIRLRVIATAGRPAAQRAMQELTANTPFELVASEYSTDASKANGGLVAPLPRGRSPLSRVPALERAVFGLKGGQTYGPVGFNKGWWIFRCEDKTPGAAPAFGTVKEDARLGAALVKGTRLNGKAIQAEFQQFQRTSNLTAFWPQYERAVTGR